MSNEHLFHEYMRQTNGVLAQLQQLALGLSESFQALNAQHQQLVQRFDTTQHRFDIVLYVLLQNDEKLRTHLAQKLERMTNPFPEDSEEYREFNGAIRSLKTLIRQCQRISSVNPSETQSASPE